MAGFLFLFSYLFPEIYKLHRHGKFMGAHSGDDGLQFASALGLRLHISHKIIAIHFLHTST
jgi:hypothetical protein